jgi:hypothetical protein
MRCVDWLLAGSGWKQSIKFVKMQVSDDFSIEQRYNTYLCHYQLTQIERRDVLINCGRDKSWKAFTMNIWSTVCILLMAVSTDHRSQNNPRGVVSVPGAVRVTADYREHYWNAIGKSDRLYYYSDWKHQAFWRRAVSERTVRKHSRWIIVTRLSTRNLCTRIYRRDHFLVCEQNSSMVRGCTAYPM